MMLGTAAALAGAVLVAARLLGLDGLVARLLDKGPRDPVTAIREVLWLAEIAGRDGRAGMRRAGEDLGNSMLGRAAVIAGDAPDSESTRIALEREMDRVSRAEVLRWRRRMRLGRFGPVVALVGLIAGLAAVYLPGGDPRLLGPAGSVALIALVFGAFIVSAVTGMLGDRANAAHAERTLIRTIITAGLVAIREGRSPASIEGQLLAYLPPSMRQRAMREAA